jgi:hypothetical protein
MSLKDCKRPKEKGKGQKGKVIPITQALRKRLENQSFEDVLADVLSRRFKTIDRELKAIDRRFEANNQNHRTASKLLEEVFERLNTLGAYALVTSVLVAELRGRPLTREAKKDLAINLGMDEVGAEEEFGETPQAGLKKYLPGTLQDRGPFPTAKAIYTDDKPLSPDGDHAILIDRQGKCWFRSARIEADKVIITAWQWPHGEAAVPLDHFETIERVNGIDFKRD